MFWRAVSDRCWWGYLVLADKEEVQIVDIVSSEMGYLLQKQSSKWLVVQNELIEAGTGFWSKAYMWLIEEANI